MMLCRTSELLFLIHCKGITAETVEQKKQNNKKYIVTFSSCIMLKTFLNRILASEKQN